MNTKNFLRILLGFALVLCVSLAPAQTVTGTITGQVTDPSGAVVPGAKVVATDLDTSVSTSATTNADGLFRIQFLPIGHYQVAITAPGFKNGTIAPFSLEVQQTANFNVKLEVGSTTTSVSVSAAAPILNTSSPTIGSVFTANT
ncbi:MAG: carboxypeptidase-like regulatory domain-containing protein, partial [Acidobacteriota bacterium]